MIQFFQLNEEMDLFDDNIGNAPNVSSIPNVVKTQQPNETRGEMKQEVSP